MPIIIQWNQSQDTISFKCLLEAAKQCHKFDETIMLLVSVSQICCNNMTLLFNSKGVLVNNGGGETVIKGHLDLGNNLYMILIYDKNDIT